MSKYIGNCNHCIDWNSLILTLSTASPAYTGPRHSGADDIIGIKDIQKKWDDAGYVLHSSNGSAGWDMFFPGKQFEVSYVSRFAEFVGMRKVESAWVSRVNPGMMTPLHWDANDSEEEYAKLPDMARFSCNISSPQAGHVLVVDDECLYMQPQGSVWQWNSRKSWHAGANFGYTPKYLFNIFGHL